MSSKKTAPRRVGTVELESCMCCGLGEYDGFNYGTEYRSYDSLTFTSSGAIRAMVEDGNFISRHRSTNDYDDVTGCSHIILSQVVQKKTGYRNLSNFKRYVERHKLGTVVLSGTKKNPNSGNKVKAGLFTPHVTAMAKWGIERGIEDRHAEEMAENRRWSDHW